MGSLREDLSSRFRELRETHISLVFLDDSEVFKVEKPISTYCDAICPASSYGRMPMHAASSMSFVSAPPSNL